VAQLPQANSQAFAQAKVLHLPVAMNELILERLFRRVLLAALAPSLLGTVGCGEATGAGGGSDASMPSDGGTRDVRATPDTGPDATGSCEPMHCGGCGSSCGPGCEPTMECVDGAYQYGCNCDAGIDAGLSCEPDRTQCTFYLPLDCLDASVPQDAAALTETECKALCGASQITACFTVEASGGSTVLECACALSTGRRPEGFRPGRARRGRRVGAAVGQYFASMAQLEAASVGAFRVLAAELAAHGAPAHLRVAAKRAARDEVRHARVMRGLARKNGTTVPRGKPVAVRPRSLEAIAIENAVEGCVRETFGALLATLQARLAKDADVREVMVGIATDETRHASLGWSVAAWALPRLDEAGRARVAAARAAAVAELLGEVQQEPAEELRVVGLPSAAQARQLMVEMKRALWAA
jgi:hypothetical protein